MIKFMTNWLHNECTIYSCFFHALQKFDTIVSITHNKNIIRIKFNVSSLKQLGFEEPASQCAILIYMNESRVLKKKVCDHNLGHNITIFYVAETKRQL